MNGINQISIFLENRAGSLSEITQLLADSGINLRAISIAETADYGVLRVIADDTEKARDVLLENGCILSMTPVAVLTLPDKPASLSKVLLLLAEKGIDIEYMYSLFTHQDGYAYIVFRLAEEGPFREIVKNYNLTIATKEELGLK